MPIKIQSCISEGNSVFVEEEAVADCMTVYGLFQSKCLCVYLSFSLSLSHPAGRPGSTSLLRLTSRTGSCPPKENCPSTRAPQTTPHSPLSHPQPELWPQASPGLLSAPPERSRTSCSPLGDYMYIGLRDS